MKERPNINNIRSGCVLEHQSKSDQSWIHHLTNLFRDTSPCGQSAQLRVIPWSNNHRRPYKDLTPAQRWLLLVMEPVKAAMTANSEIFPDLVFWFSWEFESDPVAGSSVPIKQPNLISHESRHIFSR